MKIMYKDRNTVVCVKEIGMLSEGNSEGKNNERALPSEAVKALAEMGEGGEVFTVHRLDKQVGGLTLLARNPKAAAYYTSLFQTRGIEKKYLAVIHGKPENESGTYTDLLFRDASKNKTYVVDRMRKGVREATLDYSLLDAKEDTDGSVLSLVEITLHTGRTHQIRVQFSHRKMPLVKDGRYGARQKENEKSSEDFPALFAYSLSFKDMKGNKRNIKVLPENNTYPWNLFNLK